MYDKPVDGFLPNYGLFMPYKWGKNALATYPRPSWGPMHLPSARAPPIDEEKPRTAKGRARAEIRFGWMDQPSNRSEVLLGLLGSMVTVGSMGYFTYIYIIYVYDCICL